MNGREANIAIHRRYHRGRQAEREGATTVHLGIFEHMDDSGIPVG